MAWHFLFQQLGTIPHQLYLLAYMWLRTLHFVPLAYLHGCITGCDDGKRITWESVGGNDHSTLSDKLHVPLVLLPFSTIIKLLVHCLIVFFYNVFLLRRQKFLFPHFRFRSVNVKHTLFNLCLGSSIART